MICWGSVYPSYPRVSVGVMYVGLIYGVPALKAAQMALQAAERRRKLAARVAGCGDGADKRSRPTPTNSTQVTPEGKKPCGDRGESSTTDSGTSDIEPRKLSFDDSGDNIPA